MLPARKFIAVFCIAVLAGGWCFVISDANWQPGVWGFLMALAASGLYYSTREIAGK